MGALRWIGFMICVAFATLNFTQPLWVDDTPAYTPWLGVFAYGPACAFGAVVIWKTRNR
jgi:hypothetical protein